jgi:hypothetical protein
MANDGARMIPQRTVGRRRFRVVLVYIQRHPGELAGVECCDDVGDDVMFAAADIDLRLGVEGFDDCTLIALGDLPRYGLGARAVQL